MSADDHADDCSHDRAVAAATRRAVNRRLPRQFKTPEVRPVRKALSIVAGQILLIAGFYLLLMPDRSYFQAVGGVAVIAAGVALLFQGRVRGRLLPAKPIAEPTASLHAARGAAIVDHAHECRDRIKESWAYSEHGPIRESGIDPDAAVVRIGQRVAEIHDAADTAGRDVDVEVLWEPAFAELTRLHALVHYADLAGAVMPMLSHFEHAIEEVTDDQSRDGRND